MIWNSYGTPNEFGGLNGMQSDVAPVSSGLAWRLIRYFSAPGLSVGGAAAPPPPTRPGPPNRFAQPNTPVKSGLPSGVRGIPPLDAAAAVVALAATGVVPGMVTVTVFVTEPAVNVYVVVALGVTRSVPRGTTRPSPWSSVPNPPKPLAEGGFSITHESNADSPARIVAGRASKVTMRGSGAGAPRPRPCAGAPPGGAAPPAGACANATPHEISRAAVAIRVRHVRTADIGGGEFLCCITNGSLGRPAA